MISQNDRVQFSVKSVSINSWPTGQDGAVLTRRPGLSTTDNLVLLRL